MTRKLATIRRIDAIRPIANADAIELAVFGGWQVVIKKDEFKAGDPVIYVEIDSWVPHEIAPFLSKGQEPREYGGVKGERLRTVTLRGEISQGLVLPRTIAAEEGDDVTEILGIQKWERPIEAHLAGLVKGDFPTFIRKPDQERFQNIYPEIQYAIGCGHLFEVTVKMDGTSVTVYYKDGEVGVCSRNLELKLEGNDENSLVKWATESGMLEALRSYGRNIAVQGELCGEGIQKNREKVKGHQFFMYDIFDIDRQTYLAPQARYEAASNLEVHGIEILPHVPVLYKDVSLKSIGVATPDDLHKIAPGPGHITTQREGLVFKRNDGKFSFKAISNTYLKKNNE